MILDPLWGPPAAAALQADVPGRAPGPARQRRIQRKRDGLQSRQPARPAGLDLGRSRPGRSRLRRGLPPTSGLSASRPRASSPPASASSRSSRSPRPGSCSAPARTRSSFCGSRERSADPQSAGSAWARSGCQWQSALRRRASRFAPGIPRAPAPAGGRRGRDRTRGECRRDWARGRASCDLRRAQRRRERRGAARPQRSARSGRSDRGRDELDRRRGDGRAARAGGGGGSPPDAPILGTRAWPRRGH